MTHSLPPSQYRFPNPLVIDPDGYGVVAIGGDLAPSTLLEAYQQGLFPWFGENEPITWWSPEPRCLIYPRDFNPSRSLRRTARSADYRITLDHAFGEVVSACAAPRAYADSTWISDDVRAGYLGLHHAGLAHSVEVWEGSELVGGLYGVQLGGAFFGESMFSRRTDVSKLAFWFLMRLSQASGFEWVDCQLPNDHLISLGAITVPREQFLGNLQDALARPAPNWQTLKNEQFLATDLLTSDIFSGLI